jgi:hypothetical protein
LGKADAVAGRGAEVGVAQEPVDGRTGEVLGMIRRHAVVEDIRDLKYGVGLNG